MTNKEFLNSKLSTEEYLDKSNDFMETLGLTKERLEENSEFLNSIIQKNTVKVVKQVIGQITEEGVSSKSLFEGIEISSDLSITEDILRPILEEFTIKDILGMGINTIIGKLKGSIAASTEMSVIGTIHSSIQNSDSVPDIIKKKIEEKFEELVKKAREDGDSQIISNRQNSSKAEELLNKILSKEDKKDEDDEDDDSFDKFLKSK